MTRRARRRTRSRMRLRFAHGLLRQRKFDLAAEEYERFLASRPSGADRARRPLRPGQRPARPGTLCRCAAGLRRFPRGSPGRSAVADSPISRRRALVPDGRPAGRRRALEAFTAVRSHHPALETAWTYLGDVCFALNDLAGGAGGVRTVAGGSSPRPARRSARYGLARTLAAAGDRDRAVRLLRELAEQGGPEWVDRAWLQIGSIELAAGRPAEAARRWPTLERAVPDSPPEGEARLRRARALDRLGRSDEAGRLLARAGRRARESAGGAGISGARHDRAGARTAQRRRWPRSTRSSSAACGRLCGRRCSSGRPRPCGSSTAWMRPRRGSSRSSRPLPTTPGPTTPCTAPRGRRSIARTPPRPVGWPAEFAAKFPRSPLSRRGPADRGSRRRDGRRSPRGGRPCSKRSSSRPTPPGATVPPLPPRRRSRTRVTSWRWPIGPSADRRDAERLLARLAEEPAGPVAADAQFLLGQAHVEAGRYRRGHRAAGALPGRQPPRRRRRVRPGRPGRRPARRGPTRRCRQDAGDPGPPVPRRQGPAAGPAPGRRGRPGRQGVRPCRRAIPPGGRTVQPGDKPAPHGSAISVIRRFASAPWPGWGDAPGTWPAGRGGVGIRRGPGAGPERPGRAGMALARAMRWKPRTGPRTPSPPMPRPRPVRRGDEGPRAALARARLLAKLGRHGTCGRRSTSGSSMTRVRDRPREDRRRRPTRCSPSWAGRSSTRRSPRRPIASSAACSRSIPTSPHAADARFNLAESANQAHDYAEVVRLLSPLAAIRPTRHRRRDRRSDSLTG